MAKAKIELKPRLIVKGERAIGPGKAELLEHIKTKGSISAAAKAMKMSYSRAWKLVDTMNSSFKKPLVEAESGGKRGGGAHVTEMGDAVLSHYRELQSALNGLTGKALEKFEPLLK